jgi:hypothetical protein
MSAVVTCDGCGETTVCTQQEHLPDYGWALPYEQFGYYGGFTDEIEVLLGQRETNLAILCHDCVVKVLNALPMLANKIAPDDGHHPYEGETPCCKWAWKSPQ